MAKSRFDQVQKMAAVQMVKAGKPIIDVCCEYRISSATYYSWRRKFDNKIVSGESPAQSHPDSKPINVAGLCPLPEKQPVVPAAT